MTTSRITSIRFNTTKPRKEPKRGDMRWLKGRKVWQIRQEQMMDHPLHGRCYVVSRGRHIWEWVDRCSDDDREWSWSSRQGDPVNVERRAYFERGCLCIIAGAIDIRPSEGNTKAVARYMSQCKCSRHPDGSAPQ